MSPRLHNAILIAASLSILSGCGEEAVDQTAAQQDELPTEETQIISESDLAVAPATIIVAGSQAEGRCNVLGIKQPDQELLEREPPLALSEWEDEFFAATLNEANSGDYNDVPGYSFVGDTFMIEGYGDCEEASQGAIAFLDRSIARMDGWGVERPVTYRLFLPEQVEGMSESEVDNLWRVGEIEPLGPTNAE